MCTSMNVTKNISMGKGGKPKQKTNHLETVLALDHIKIDGVRRRTVCVRMCGLVM